MGDFYVPIMIHIKYRYDLCRKVFIKKGVYSGSESSFIAGIAKVDIIPVNIAVIS